MYTRHEDDPSTFLSITKVACSIANATPRKPFVI